MEANDGQFKSKNDAGLIENTDCAPTKRVVMPPSENPDEPPRLSYEQHKAEIPNLRVYNAVVALKGARPFGWPPTL